MVQVKVSFFPYRYLAFQVLLLRWLSFQNLSRFCQTLNASYGCLFCSMDLYIHTSLQPCIHTPSKIHGWQNYLWTGLPLLCMFCRLRGDMPAHRFVPSSHSFSSRLHTVFLWLTTPPPLLPPVQWWQKGLQPLSPGQAYPLEFSSFNICASTAPQRLF